MKFIQQNVGSEMSPLTMGVQTVLANLNSLKENLNIFFAKLSLKRLTQKIRMTNLRQKITIFHENC